MGWVISQANEWEDYSNYFGEGAGISRNWATAHFLTFYGWPQNCHGARGCVISHILMFYNECIMRLKVYWRSNLPPSWTQIVLTSLCHVLWLYVSFKICALLPSLLFHLEISTLFLEPWWPVCLLPLKSPPLSSLQGEGDFRAWPSPFSGHWIQACFACTKLSFVIGSVNLSSIELPHWARKASVQLGLQERDWLIQ